MMFLSRVRFAVVLGMGLLLFSCAVPEPESLHYGEDVCDYCRMTIVERNFGSELVTNKAKVYKFDAIECLAAFKASDMVAADDIHSMWITDFLATPSLVNTSQANFVHTDHARSPMGVGLFGFSSPTGACVFAEEHQGKVVEWAELVRLVEEVWKLESSS